jgi:hypothetical protein
VPRYRCTTPAYGRAVSDQDVGKLAAPRASTTRHCARYVLRRLMIDRISAIAAELGVSWHTVGSIAMRATSGLIAAYADPNRRRGTKAMTRLIESIRRGVPAGLEELAQLGRTPSRRRADILAFFDHHASNGPPRPSTAAWKPCAATPLASETSPTTAGAHSCTAAHSTHSPKHSELRRATLARGRSRLKSTPATTSKIGRR